MKVKELIEELQKLDPELVVTRNIEQPIDIQQKIETVRVREGSYFGGEAFDKKVPGKYVCID